MSDEHSSRREPGRTATDVSTRPDSDASPKSPGDADVHGTAALDALATDVRRDILVAAAGPEPVAAEELIRRTGASESTVYRHLSALLDADLVTKVTFPGVERPPGYRTVVSSLFVDVSPEGVTVRADDENGYRAAVEHVLDGVDLRGVSYDPDAGTLSVQLGVDDDRVTDVLDACSRSVGVAPILAADANAD